MNFTIVAASHRRASESGRISRFLEDFVSSEWPDRHQAYRLDLGEIALPLWNDDVAAPGATAAWESISAKLKSSDAFIVVTPEWGGMVPPALTNLFLWCSDGELTHKAALIVAVSSGLGGAYPVAELRATSSKNTKICYIPEQVIIRQVTRVFVDMARSPQEMALLGRIRYSLNLLFEYGRALREIRDRCAIQIGEFRYGM